MISGEEKRKKKKFKKRKTQKNDSVIEQSSSSTKRTSRDTIKKFHACSCDWLGEGGGVGDEWARGRWMGGEREGSGG